MQGGTLAEPMVARKSDLPPAVNLVTALPDVSKGTATGGMETVDKGHACDQFYKPAGAATPCRGAFNDALSARPIPKVKPAPFLGTLTMTPEHTITAFHGLPGPAVGQPMSGRTGYLTSLPARMIGILAAILAVMALLAVKAPAGAAEAIIVQSTTSTQNAGFYRHVLPAFTAETGITVKVVAVGTGQALKNAQNCDGDMLIVHARTAEQAFIDAGYGAARYDLMYNDFIIVGPQRDPAGLRYAADAREAMRRIQRAGARFASRGDESGTHKKEQDLWRAIGTNPEALPGSWYLETGSGMGATLNFSVQSDSHALTDRATWLSFANKFRHRILFEGDPRLFNQYGIVTLDPGHCPTANHEGAMRFADWLLSPDGQERIGSLTRKGEQLFIPNAGTR